MLAPLSLIGSFVAATDIHVSLKAEPIFTVGPLTVTNSMIYGVICAVLIGAFFVWVAKRIHVKAQKGVGQIVEFGVEYIVNLLHGPLGSHSAAVKYAPLFGAYFFFIICTNLLGLVPLVGPGLTVDIDGTHTPLFRPFTADLNGTIAMAVIAIIMVQVLSVREQGGKKHMQHYFTNKPFNPINLFVGILDIFGEFTRVLSLSLRLFLNTAVGEILIAVFTSMIAANGRTPLAAIPIFLFEMLVAYIQAYVFTVLSATYLGLAISHAHEYDDDHQPARIPDEVEARGMHGG